MNTPIEQLRAEIAYYEQAISVCTDEAEMARLCKWRLDAKRRLVRRCMQDRHKT